jgi:Na+-driven multidrug efflux pump
LSGAFTVAASVVFVAKPLPFLEIFTRDATVLATATTLLFVYAMFQPFELQTVCTGAARRATRARSSSISSGTGSSVCRSGLLLPARLGRHRALDRPGGGDDGRRRRAVGRLEWPV